jgi:hypothetical protein
MSTDPPSRAQLRYLKNLGYTGKRPRTKGQASAAIDEMKRSGDSDKAEKAIKKERELERDEAELAEPDQQHAPRTKQASQLPTCLGCLMLCGLLAVFTICLACALGYGTR